MAELITLLKERQKFKDWVHKYLDDHGVPHHPPGVHGASGCRIGDRMDWLMAEVDRLSKLVEGLQAGKPAQEAPVQPLISPRRVRGR